MSGKSVDSERHIQAEVRVSPRATVLLVSGKHIAAAGLRSLLIDSSAVRLVGDQRQGPGAVMAAERHQPSVILVGCDGVSESTVEFLKQLRAASPESRIIAFSDDVDQERVKRATEAPVDGYLSWASVTKDTMEPILALALADIWIGSKGAVGHLASAPERPGMGGLGLTPEERLLVDALNADLTPEEMGERLPLSPRTRQRTMNRLLRRFGVRTAFMLGKRLANYDPDR